MRKERKIPGLIIKYQTIDINDELIFPRLTYPVLI